MARLPLLSLLSMGPPFGRGGADATGDRRGAGEGLGERPAGCVRSSRDRRQVTGDRRQAGDKSADLETEDGRKPMKLVGWNADRNWAELPHWVKAPNQHTSTPRQWATADGD